MNTPVANKYGWTSAKAEHSHSYLLPVVIHYLKHYNVQSMLDIGTGNGAALPKWISLGYKVAAMEPDEEGYYFAKRYEKADVRQIGVSDGLPAEWKNRFDAVVSLEVIEHLFEPSQLAHCTFRILKKDGIAIISTPYHGYWKNMLLALLNKWDFHHHPLRTGGHIKFWSRKTLSELFIKEGFSVESFKGIGRFPFLWKSMIMVFKKINS